MASEKLQRLHEYVLVTIVMVCGVLLAMYCGRLAGTGETSTLAKMLVAAVAVVICLTMRTRIWMLIPTGWSLSGQLNALPGHLPLRDGVIGLVVIFFLTLKAFKIIRSRPVYGWLDILLGINLLYLLSAYLRHPVGVNSFGTDLVGGRPYLEVIFAMGGYWVLQHVRMTEKQTKMLPFLFIAVNAALTLLSTLTYLVPSLAPVLGKLYSGIDAESYTKEQHAEEAGLSDEEVGGRAQYLAYAGQSLFGVLCSYFQPFTLFNPLYLRRFLLTIVAFYFILKSGHRITIPAVAATFFLATYFRKGISGIVIISLIFGPVLLLVVTMQGHVFDLPKPMQRTLCFLPAKWDPDVVKEAQGSSEWRFQMWSIVLHEDKYIHNKMFGDGFGFTREEMDNMAAEGSQENFMILGDVHSGPVSCIHIVGYVGTVLFIGLLVGVSVRGWQLVRMTKGTRFFSIGLFFGLPAITGVIFFVFIFGDYKTEVCSVLINVGILNLLRNALITFRKEAAAPGPLPVAHLPAAPQFGEPRRLPALRN